MYADDTSLTFASADLRHVDDCLNYDLKRVYTWLLGNKVTLNLIKNLVHLSLALEKTAGNTSAFAG